MAKAGTGKNTHIRQKPLKIPHRREAPFYPRFPFFFHGLRWIDGIQPVAAALGVHVQGRVALAPNPVFHQSKKNSLPG
jgi:hypothetical protein